MSDFTNKQIKNTYKDLLTVNSGTDNQGIESTLKTVSDGEGVETAIQLSTTTLKIPTGKTLEIAGTLNSVDAVLTGNLSVGDDLTVTDLISGASMVLTGSMSSASIAVTGNITNTDGYLMLNRSSTGSNSVLNVRQSSTGTIAEFGTDSANNQIVFEVGGNITALGTTATDRLEVGGGYGGVDTGLTIYDSGNLATDGSINCATFKTSEGKLSTGGSDSPKVDVSDETKVKFTLVDASDDDKDVFEIKNTGETIIKDNAGDTKFTVKSDGRLKLKTLTATQRDAISSPEVGEMVVLTDGSVHFYKS
tara:strand:+ start:10566 stop:11483 length:918 start_codon:yes stop_codon:yes gene_type:complete